MKRERIVEHVAETQEPSGSRSSSSSTCRRRRVAAPLLLRGRARQGQDTRESFNARSARRSCAASFTAVVRAWVSAGLTTAATGRPDLTALVAGQQESTDRSILERQFSPRPGRVCMMTTGREREGLGIGARGHPTRRVTSAWDVVAVDKRVSRSSAVAFFAMLGRPAVGRRRRCG